MNPLGVHALVWVGDWTEPSIRRAANATADLGFEVLEVPLLDPSEVDPELTRRILEPLGLTPSCSLGLSLDAEAIFALDDVSVDRGQQPVFHVPASRLRVFSSDLHHSPVDRGDAGHIALTSVLYRYPGLRRRRLRQTQRHRLRNVRQERARIRIGALELRVRARPGGKAVRTMKISEVRAHPVSVPLGKRVWTAHEAHDTSTAIVVEVLNGYRTKEKLPSNIAEMTVPLGVPEVIREGSDVTLVTYGATLKIVMEAVELLSSVGIDAEVIDVQTLLPFDTRGVIVESLKKTSRIAFIDEDVPGGATAFMMQNVLERDRGYEAMVKAMVT